MIFPGSYSANSAENKTFRPRRSSSRSRPKSSGIATSHPGIATSHPASPKVIPASPQVIPASPQIIPASPQVIPASPQVIPASPQITPASSPKSSRPPSRDLPSHSPHCNPMRTSPASLRGFARNRGNPVHTAPASLRGFAKNRGNPVCASPASLRGSVRNRGNPTRTSPASLRGFARNRGNPVHTSPENDCFARLTPYSQRQGGTHYIRKDKKTASQAENPYQEGAHRRAALRKAPPALHRVHGRVLFRLPSVAGPRPAIRAPPEGKRKAPRKAELKVNKDTNLTNYSYTMPYPLPQPLRIRCTPRFSHPRKKASPQQNYHRRPYRNRNRPENRAHPYK